MESSSPVFSLFIVKHFGFLCLIFALIFAGMQQIYALIKVRKNPELADGYRKVVLGYWILMGFPWLIMAIGELIYGFSSILFILMLKDGNIFSWLFFIVLLGEYAFLLVWVWFRGGGDHLYKYRLFSYRFSSPLVAKLFITLAVLGGTIAMVALVSINFA
jgi:hypothetical protein